MMEKSGNRVLDLAALLCDELITAEQFAELDEMLASSREARDAYRGFLTLHQRLQSGALAAEAGAPVISPFVAVPGPANISVFPAVATAPDLIESPPTPPRDMLEGRLRKAERRARWSMVACIAATLFLIAFLFRSKLETRVEKSFMAAEPGRYSMTGKSEPGASPENESRGEPQGSVADRPPVSPPPAPTSGGRAPAPSVAAAARIEEANGGFLSREVAINGIAVDRSAGREDGIDLAGGSAFTVEVQPKADETNSRKWAHRGVDSFSEDIPDRARFEAESPEFLPSYAQAAPPARPNLDFEDQVNHLGKDRVSQVRPVDLDDAGQAAGEGREQATISLVDRVPTITTTINETELSNNESEEVRYQVDLKDPVGDPATTREIGVQMAVTPTLLPDGTIRMKMRPRQGQIVGEMVSQSGNRYTRISESMLESIARVPEGHSVVLGGFYGEVKLKDDGKVPLLGNIPVTNFFFKDKEAAKEPANLLFVATPTSIDDRVVIETKILKVNSSAGERTDVDWTSSLEGNGVPLESVGSLNSLLGIERTGEVSSGASGAPIVLSAAQTEGVLRALSSGGLVKQLSNPTLVVENKPIAQSERERKMREGVEKSAAAEPYSTFSLHVSDVSFKLAKASLARGEWPAPDELRVEEFVNAFDYGDPAPNQEEKVSCKMEQAAHPFLQQRNLLRVSMKTAALGRSANTPLRLTVLLDRSGSMDRMDRVDSVKNALQFLADQLNPQDQVTLIGFARRPRLLADRVAGDKVGALIKVIESTPVEGGTNLEQALELGLAKANEQMLEGAQNRIILLTDGAANLGNAVPQDLAKLVERMRQQGIAFDACGVGAAGLNDGILESLTRKGDGRYYFLDRPEDADDGFARQIAGALRPAARNVKVQVNFNPNRVGRYKLYGFEKHRLKKEDFRNDKVDAAELAAEEAGNAIYQVEFLPEGHGEIGTVSVRFQDSESGRMIEREWTIPYDAQAPRLEDAAASLRLASSAALLGEKLKGSPLGESVEMARLGKLMNSLISEFPSDQRVKDLVQMANKTRELSGE